MLRYRASRGPSRRKGCLLSTQLSSNTETRAAKYLILNVQGNSLLSQLAAEPTSDC
jgi:hypothetical protein